MKNNSATTHKITTTIFVLLVLVNLVFPAKALILSYGEHVHGVADCKARASEHMAEFCYDSRDIAAVAGQTLRVIFALTITIAMFLWWRKRSKDVKTTKRLVVIYTFLTLCQFGVGYLVVGLTDTSWMEAYPG